MERQGRSMSQRQRRAPTRYSPGSGGRRSSLPGLNVQLPPPPHDHPPPEDEVLDDTHMQESDQNNVDNTVVVVNIQNSINNVHNGDGDNTAENVVEEPSDSDNVNAVELELEEISEQREDEAVDEVGDQEDEGGQSVNWIRARGQSQEFLDRLAQDLVLEEDQVFRLAGRTQPDLPQPSPPVQTETDTETGNGWQDIDRLGAEKSFLCRFSLLEDVSMQHRGAWAAAFGKVLQRWKAATTEEETTRALLWLGFLPQALQRKPTRGGKVGRAQVAYRYSCLTEDDWGSLVELWERDTKRMLDRGRRVRREMDEKEALVKLRREVLGLFSSGQIGRGMRLVTSHGLADPQDPGVRAELQQKFPDRRYPLPDAVPKIKPIEKFRGLRESLLSLQPGTSPGSGGMRPEYLIALGERLEQTDLDLLEEFGLAYVAGDLPPWLYSLWLSLQTVPLYKTAERKRVRPLGIRHSLPRLFHREVMLQNKPAVREYLEPQQLGQSQGGAAKLVHSVRGLLDQHPEFVCVVTDIQNCYNEVSRRGVLEVLCNTPELAHLTTFGAAILAPEAALESGGKVWGRAREGLVQGDTASGSFQAIGLQPSLVQLDMECSKGGGMARAGADDVMGVGLPEVVIPAMEKFAANIWEKCGLRLQWDKSRIFCREGELPDYTTPGLSLASEQVGDTFLRGMMVYGVPVGSPEYVAHKLEQQAEEIIRDAEKTREVLSTERQALWSALRLSISQRFQYLMQLVPPSLVEPVAAKLDIVLWRILESAAGFPIAHGGEQDGLTLRVPVPTLDNISFQEWAVRLPVRLHGWGLRSLEDSCGPAYIGALETAIPYTAGLDKICPMMEDTWGGEDCWGEVALVQNRWRKVLASGCNEGQELHRAWTRIQTEGRNAAEWLGEDVPSVLDTPVEGVGDGSVSGATRKRVVEQVENMRAKVLEKSLSDVRPKTTRAAWAWRQKDKVSSSWLLAIPGHETTLSSAEFSEAAAASLCLPSPACSGRVGEVIKGRVTIDEYGDNIQATALPGDHWRRRHNFILQLLHRMCMWAGLPAEMEVFNLFSGLLRQEGLSRLEQHQQRQGLVPDMRIQMQSSSSSSQRAVVASPVLHELKIISCSKTRYKPTSEARAVDARADKLQQEYIMKARNADRKYNGVREGEVGRVERKLVELGEIKGLVCGNFGEVSEATHQLLAVMATSRVRVTGPMVGRRGLLRSEAGERAVVISSLRRRLGVATVRAQSSSLLGRLESLGPGSAAARNRRWQASELDRQWRMEDQATALARKTGRNAYRTGFGKKE